MQPASHMAASAALTVNTVKGTRVPFHGQKANLIDVKIFFHGIWSKDKENALLLKKTQQFVSFSKSLKTNSD